MAHPHNTTQSSTPQTKERPLAQAHPSQIHVPTLTAHSHSRRPPWEQETRSPPCWLPPPRLPPPASSRPRPDRTYRLHGRRCRACALGDLQAVHPRRDHVISTVSIFSSASTVRSILKRSVGGKRSKRRWIVVRPVVLKARDLAAMHRGELLAAMVFCGGILELCVFHEEGKLCTRPSIWGARVRHGVKEKWWCAYSAAGSIPFALESSPCSS